MRDTTKSRHPKISVLIEFTFNVTNEHFKPAQKCRAMDWSSYRISIGFTI